jgi:hypothetical protein
MGVGRIRDVDGQTQFGRGAGQVLVEARERGDAAVESFGGLSFGHHAVAPALNVGDRHPRLPRSPWPPPASRRETVRGSR